MRALAIESNFYPPKTGGFISYSVVAPAATLTPILAGGDVDASVQLGGTLQSIGMPVNTPDQLADAFLYLIEQDRQANGRGILVQGGKMVDLEYGLANTLEDWMTPEIAKDHVEHHTDFGSGEGYRKLMALANNSDKQN